MQPQPTLSTLFLTNNMKNSQKHSQRVLLTKQQIYSKKQLSRVTINWKKVSDIFLKRNKNGQTNNHKGGFKCEKNSQQQKNEKNRQFTNKKIMKELHTKNSMYNLFDNKQSSIIIIIIKQLQNESQQHKGTIDQIQVIQTKYNLFSNQSSQQPEQSLSQQKQISNSTKLINLTTHTPLPNLSTIIKNTQATFNTTNNNIDTTGYWIWEAQEILGMGKSENYQIICEKMKNCDSVLELGAGSSGLASIMLAKMINNHRKVKILITDGKEQNILFLQQNIKLNFSQTQLKEHIFIQAKHYLWGDTLMNQSQLEKKQNFHPEQKFNLIVAADCLFFQQYHQNVIQTLEKYMQQKSIAIFIQPKRGKSMENFIKKLQQNEIFQYFMLDFTKFDQKFNKQMIKVKQKQKFDHESHQFHFLIINKKKNVIVTQQDKINKCLNNKQNEIQEYQNLKEQSA